MNSIDNFLNEKLAANGTIIWGKPNLSEEIGEYTENSHTKQWLKSKGIVFNTDKEILSFLSTGKMASITKEELMKNYENLSLTIKDFKREIEDIDYLKSFLSMENSFQMDR
jgi:hypothetical protein